MMRGAGTMRRVAGTRTEQDSLGPVDVPEQAYHGAQTQRALEHFAIGGERMPPSLIHAYGHLKAAAAEANLELGLLSPEVAALIVAAAEEVARGELDAHFPLAVWQTGSGTQSHMNVNEVIANRVSELAGEPRGSKRPAHPNDHVNRGQSSNDTFPSAMQIAAVLAIETRLLPAVRALRGTLESKGADLAPVVKLGRTHLQDAVPLTLGQELAAWAAQLTGAEHAIAATLPALRALPLGGTAVGTGLGTHPEFAARCVAHIGERTGHPFAAADNPFAGIAAHDACVGASGALKQLAAAGMKLANDVRLLCSGPRAGLGELRIPANEPGSSIMPGKVNPTQAEALSMVACQVIGNDVAIAVAASQGQLQLNTFKPVIAHNLLQSITLLTDACTSFDEHCARGIEPNRKQLQRHLERSLMLVTALVPEVGYDAAARIAKYAHEHYLPLRDAALALGLLTAERFDELVDPVLMVRPRA